MWRNTYKEGDKSPTFASPVFVPPLAPACTLGWGLGLHDRAVRFGDLGKWADSCPQDNNQFMRLIKPLPV